MKKAIKKTLSVILVVVIMLTAAPLSGFVGLELPDWMDFSVWVKAATSNTAINFPDDTQKHLLGSNFSITANYSSNTYSHNSETISCEISGPEDGLIYNGMSCLGTPEDGFVGVSFTASKVGKYVVTLTTVDGATDSIDIEITTESLNEFLANAIRNKQTITKPKDILIYEPDMTWTLTECFYTALGEGTGIDLSETQIVEIIMIRVLVEKLTHDNFVEQVYAEAASDITKCITGVIALDKSITQNTSVNSLSVQVREYINDYYNFDVFDTLSSVVNGTTTLLNATQVASFYKAVSNNVSAEQLRNMIAPILPLLDGYSDICSVQLIENSYVSLFNAIENADIKIADYFADTTVKYGLETLKEIVKDVTVNLATVAITAVCPPLGAVFSIGMNAIELCNSIDSLFTGKLEGVEKSLGIVNILGELYYKAIYYWTSSETASEVVESYRFLIAANQVAVNIQKDNTSLIENKLLSDVISKVSFKGLLPSLIERIEMHGSDYEDTITSYSLIVENYPQFLENAEQSVNNEREFLLKSIEDYLLYVYGSDVYLYNSDLWEIPTRYTITYSQNYSNNSYKNYSIIDFAYEGEKLDERMKPSSRSGYNFTGWYTDSLCSKEYDFSAIVTSDLTLYAGWEKIIEYETIDDVNSRVTGVNYSSSTYRMSSATVETIPLNDALSQIDVIIPICIDSHIINRISSGAIPISVNSVFIPESVECIEDGAIPSTTKIYCESNTYAEEYAKNNGYEYILSNDGESNITSGKVGPLSYRIKDGSATITACDNNFEGIVTIPKQIGCYDVTVIDYEAFKGCYNITNINIPNSVKEIGENSFSDCTNITNVDIPDSVINIGRYAFSNCSNIEKITIGSAVISIGNYAFADCINVVQINYNATDASDNINEDSYNLFENTGVLGEGIKVIIGDNVKAIPENLFWSYMSYAGDSRYVPPKIDSVTIGKNVEIIGDGAFARCGDLTNITFLGDKLTVIEDEAFSGCSFTSITFPNSLRSIGWRSFANCPLESLIIPDSVIGIGPGAFNCKTINTVDTGDGVLNLDGFDFYEYQNLESVVIGNSVREIPDSLFSGCQNLKSLVLGDKIIRIGKYAFNGCASLTSVTIPDSVTTIGDWAFEYCTSLTDIAIGNGVKEIGNGAFNECTSLTDIAIGNGVKEIGDYAFNNCTAISTLMLPDSIITVGEKAFYNCRISGSFTIPENVSYIGDDAFYGNCVTTLIYNAQKCYMSFYDEYLDPDSPSFDSSVLVWNDFSLFPYCTEIIFGDNVTFIPTSLIANNVNITSVHFPNNLQRIQPLAFRNCSSLNEITFPQSITSVGFCAFENTPWLINQPDGVLYIGSVAYDYIGYSWNVEEIVINPGTTRIESLAFADCYYLNSIIIPEGVTSIGVSAFRGCENLTTITLPDTVREIEDYAFSDCKSLESITLPNSVTSIGKFVFNDCISLANITVDSNNEYYSNDEYGVLFNKNKTTLIQYPVGNTRTSYTVPDSVISIGEYAFVESTGLESVIIPDSVTSIDNGAFSDCTSLASVTIPESVISIGDYAFEDCTSLTSITIPDSVTSIGYGAFEYCTSLENITIPNGVTSISSSAFYNCTSLTSITIPSNVTSIGSYAFCGCSNLVSVTISDSVTSIGAYAFEDCTSLINIYYSGTEEKWNNIVINNSYNGNGLLFNATIHYETDYPFSIKTPSTTTIRHKDGIKLHANIEGTAPAGSYVVWTASNGKFKTEEINNGNSLKIISDSNGKTTFTATLYSVDGEILATDTIEMKSKAGFFDKIGSFFRSLFGGTKIYEN